MRQKVCALKLALNITARNSAMMIWGTDDKRNIPKVLRRACQKAGCVKTHSKFAYQAGDVVAGCPHACWQRARPMSPDMLFHCLVEMYAVYSKGKSPTMAKMIKKGEMKK
jgi:hypothetical protein